jgi:predicted transcriptional regulator
MTIINAQQAASRKAQLNVRVQPDVKEALKQYCCFIHSHQNYVVEQALRYLFQKDREFQFWLVGSRTTGAMRTANAESGQVASEGSSHRTS